MEEATIVLGPQCVVCTHQEHPVDHERPEIINSQPWHDPERGICRTEHGTWGCPCAGRFQKPPACGRCQRDDFLSQVEHDAHVVEAHADELAEEKREQDARRKLNAERERQQRQSQAEEHAVKDALGAAIRGKVLSTASAIVDPEQASLCGLCRESVDGVQDLVGHVQQHRSEAGV